MRAAYRLQLAWWVVRRPVIEGSYVAVWLDAASNAVQGRMLGGSAGFLDSIEQELTMSQLRPFHIDEAMKKEWSGSMKHGVAAAIQSHMVWRDRSISCRLKMRSSRCIGR